MGVKSLGRGGLGFGEFKLRLKLKLKFKLKLALRAAAKPDGHRTVQMADTDPPGTPKNPELKLPTST